MEDHFEPPEIEQHSPLVWLLKALGFRYVVFLPFITLLALVLAIIAIGRFKTPVLTALLLAVVPLPLFYGAMATIDGMTASMQAVMISGAIVKPSNLAEGGALSLVSLQVGLVLSLLVYLLAVTALAYRALTHSEADQPPKSSQPAIGATFAPKT
jgi:hypothetical protein